MKTEELFERAPVWKSIFKMCLPTVVVMLVMTVYNMADMVFVGQTGIAAQVAAVSLASPFFLLQMTLGTWIGGGGCTVISTALGAKDTEKAKSASAACTLLSLASGVLLGGAALLFPNAFLHFFGADAATWDYTAQYLQILALGTPWWSFPMYSQTLSAPKVPCRLPSCSICSALSPILYLTHFSSPA